MICLPRYKEKFVSMKGSVLILFFALSLSVTAQKNQEDIFVENMDWAEIRRIAKVENKPIFVDAFATWCVPCKKMDRDVYSSEPVIQYMKSRFLCVKIQFDRTGATDNGMRHWRAVADSLSSRYRIEVFPTLLFFDANGDILEKAAGYQDTGQFLALCEKALDPNRSYAGLVKAYKSNVLSHERMLKLSLLAGEYQDDSIAMAVAKTYKQECLDKHDPGAILTSEHFNFFLKFSSLFSMEDNIVRYLYTHADEADQKVLSPGFSQSVTDYTIAQDVVNRTLWKDKKPVVENPDWGDLEHKIRIQYDSMTAKRIIINAKLRWYGYKQNWDSIVEYNIEKIEFNKVDTSGISKFFLNNVVYDVIFKHASNHAHLVKGIEYMKILLASNPNEYFWIDTYANLLYKIGRKAEAIKQQNIALKMATAANNKESIHIYRTNIEKMKKNEPTWK
jgi:thioredoxin-related protein